ncbi:MAG: PRD domain-containing protein [Erysipelotrichia bacterium]|nr:PRD domain-containing protein [Erysipelotrichia bacterium]
MYKILKILNHNAILVSDEKEELIVMHKGIGFSKKVDDMVDIPMQAKKYLMQKSYSKKNKGNEIIDYIDPIYLEIASEILKKTSEKFDEVDDSILLPLADHLYFVIKRMNDNIAPENPFFRDIKLLFPEEFEVALQAKAIIYEYTRKEINLDEVGFITLHIHSAVSSNQLLETMDATRVIHDSIEKLQKDLKIKIDVESISYARLMNHIKFLIVRLNKDEELAIDISEFTQEKFPFAYEQATHMCTALAEVLNKELPYTEIGYLALHLERILSSIDFS